jgi:tetratricopeptide (TPR) repeat protein
MLAVQNSLVARKKQLSAGTKRLLERLNGVASGFRSVAIGVIADAGMGKTFTVSQTINALPCNQVIIPAAEPLRWLHLRLPTLSKKIPTWASNVLEQIRNNQNLPEKTVAQALHAYFNALAPVVVHLEDTHETSTEQLALWTELAKMLNHGKGIGLIATSRTALPAEYQEFRLQNLELQAVQDVLQNLTPHILPLEAVTWIYQKSLGNPLFTLEFYQHSLRQGYLSIFEQQWLWREPRASNVIPKDLETTIMDRLEQIALLSPQPNLLKQVLLTLALLPEVQSLKDNVYSNWSEALKDVFDLELLTTGLWSENQFVHPLYAEVLRSQMWLQERTLVARDLLPMTLEIAPEFMKRLVLAAQLEPQEALKIWQQVAVMTQKQPLVAGRALAAAVDLSQGETRADIALRASQLLRQADLPEALRLSAVAREIKPDDFQIALQHINLLISNGQHEQAETVMATFSGEQLIDPEYLRLRFNLYTRYKKYQAVIDTWNSLRITPNPAHVVFYREVAAAFMALNRHDEAQALIQAALHYDLTLSQEISLRNALGNSLQQSEKSEEALQVFDDTFLVLKKRDLEKRIPLDWELTFLNRSIVLNHLGKLELAIIDLEESIKILQNSGDNYRLAMRQSNLASNLILMAQFESAEKLLLSANEILIKLPTSRFLLANLTNFCLLYIEWFTPMGNILALKYARETLVCARKIANQFDLARVLIQIAQIEVQYGDAQKALTLIEEQLSVAKSLNNQNSIAYGTWIRLLCLEATGQKLLAIHEYPGFLDTIRSENDNVEFERIALEFDRMTQDVNAAQERIQRLQNMGKVAHLPLLVAKRYFPQLFDAPQEVIVPSSLQKLEVLGEMRFSGEPISKRLRKAREFLALLLEARLTGRAAVTQLEIVDALYPNEDEEKASSSVRQLIYRLRKSFGENVVQYSSNGYVLGVASDAEGFLQTLDTTLWRGAYLAQETMKLSPNVTEALYHALARAAQESLLSNPNEAARVSRILLAANPYNIESFRLCIQALAAVQAEDLMAVYKTNRQLFVGIGEVLPESWEEWLQLEL